MGNMLCDIIVPIYNAYDDLVECVDSVLTNTRSEEYRLILINDKSTDDRIEKYLLQLQEQRIPNVSIISNKENLGFVKTCNKGINLSSNDVLLLNSDTVVTPNWLEKIRRCAYSDVTIATVTPLTNSGTICSIPNFCEDNSIPSNFTLLEYASMIEKISLKVYPIIPTAVGFCMYIKREVIDSIGNLDEKSFNKGYGEENDFCCRAIEHGYINVLCDDTFIHHKGSMSFKEEKRKYIETNLSILDKKYPYYLKNVEKFVAKNPLKDIQENIKLHIKLKNNKKNILYVLHNGILKDINNPRGGTEFHVLDLVENIDSFNKFVLVSNGNELILSAFIDKEVLDFKFKINQEIETTTFQSYKYEKLLEEILCSFDIDLVHVHHTKMHTLSIPKIANKLGIPIIITIHDFYPICPTINLLDVNGQYCEKTRNKEMCSKCIKSKMGYNTNFIDTWNKKMRESLQLYDKIITPSESAKKIINEYYSDLKLHIKVIEHGTDKVTAVLKNRINNDEKFKIGFVGGLAPYKGSGIIHDLIVNNKNRDIEWHLLGNLGDQRLNLMERKDLLKHGRYDRNEINKILNEIGIDLVCIFSVWPETYSYTLTEAWQSNIPVLVTNIGALGDRVEKLGAGWIIEYGTSTDEILKKINSIKQDKNDYKQKVDILKDFNFISKKEMANIYETEYLNLISIKNDKKLLCFDSNLIYTSYKLSNISKLSNDEEINIEMYNKVQELENEINTMRNTLGWKVIDKIRSKNPKILKLLKKVIYFFSRIFYK